MSRTNSNHIYTMIGCDIEQMLRQMGILIDNQLKFHQHSSTAISKATRRLLGLISKSFINLSPLTFLHLYKVIVRPYLEYGNIIWRRNYKVDEDSVENGRGDRLNWFHPSDIYLMKKGFSVLGSVPSQSLKY